MSEWTSGLIKAMLVIAFGSGFQHGFHTGVTNIPQQVFKTWIKTVSSTKNGTTLNEKALMLKWSVMVSVYAIGGVVGSCLTATLADNLGRKRSLLLNNLWVVVGVAISAFSKRGHSFSMLIVGRFLFGINAGLNGGLCQIYLTEIAPYEIRGAVGGFYQLMINIGILGSQISGALLGTEQNWPLMFLVPLVPAFLQTITLPFCPESPMYLLVFKGDEPSTVKSLSWLRGTSDTKQELDSLILSDNLIKELRRVTVKRLLCTNSTLRTNIYICLTMMLGQQLCGINVLIYYSTDLFNKAGVREIDTFCVTMGFSLLIIISTAVGLCVVDSLGRRKLLLFGFFTVALNTLFLTLTLLFSYQGYICKFASIFFFYLFVLFYGSGIGIIPWFYTAEVFYPTASSLAVSIAVPVNWFANVIVAQTFLPLTAAVGYYVYLVFVLLDVFFFICVYLYLPETAKKSTSDIIKLYS